MSELTKEWLQQTIAELEEERDAMPGAVNEDATMALAAMKLALTSLEAEAVAYMYKDNLHSDARFILHPRFGNWSQEDINEYEITEIPLYAAPPVPVSVPDDILLLQSEVTIWKDRCELLRELFREVADALGCDVKDNQAMLDKIEMLHGGKS